MTKPVYEWCPIGKCMCALYSKGICSYLAKPRSVDEMEQCPEDEGRK